MLFKYFIHKTDWVLLSNEAHEQFQVVKKEVDKLTNLCDYRWVVCTEPMSIRIHAGYFAGGAICGLAFAGAMIGVRKMAKK